MNPTASSNARDNIKGIILVLAQALPIMAVVSLFPAMPNLMQHFGDVPNAAYLVPMIVTLPSFCIAILSPAAGWLVDNVGRRPVLISSLTLYVVSGLAPLLLDSLVPIIVSRALLGVAEAGIVTVASTLIADYFGEHRYRWLALQSGIGAIVGTLLIALGGWLADLSWRGPFGIYFAAIPLLILSLIFLNEPAAKAQRGAEAPVGRFAWTVALGVGAVSLIASVLYYAEPTHIAAIFKERGVGSSTQIGLIQALTSLAYIVGAFLYKLLSERPVGVLLGVAGGLIAIGMVGIGLSSSTKEAAFWALFQQLGGGMVIPSLIGWAQASVPFEQRGRAMGIWATFFFTGMFLCPTIVTFTTGLSGSLSTTFWWLGLLTGSLAVVFLALGRNQRAAVAAH